MREGKRMPRKSGLMREGDDSTTARESLRKPDLRDKEAILRGQKKPSENCTYETRIQFYEGKRIPRKTGLNRQGDDSTKARESPGKPGFETRR